MSDPISDETVSNITSALKDFGYPVDFAYCRKAVDELMQGKPAVGGPMGFIRIWLRDAGLLSD